MTNEGSCIDRRALLEVTGGDAGLERRLFAQFLRLTVEDVDALRNAIASRDAPTATRAAHRLRGASGTLGALELAAVCARLERAARDGDVASLDAAIGEFEAQLRRVADYLSQKVDDADR